MENKKIHTPEVKKGLITLLMFQIYSEQRTIYREYIQNALDSINKAVEDHILIANKDGKVEINIDTHLKTVTIQDNGTGIKSKNAIKTLLDISSSTKDGVSQAGQFGIGRLVGGGYCHKLIFKTSARGEDVGTKVIFDVDKIWKLVKEDKTDYLATYVISECSTIEQFECKTEEHFFEVILEGIKDEYAPTLLDQKKVIDYLTEIAPVEYTSQFNNALIFSSLNIQPEYKDLFEKLEKVQIFVNSKRIQKQYGLTIKGTKDEINNLEFFKIEDVKYGLLAWGWFALTKFTIQIPKTDNLAFIRLRKHNIQIGSFNQLSGSSYWKEERSNSYFYGEVFVCHPNIMPNAARDGLAPSPETFAFNKLLKEYFENLKSLYTKANAAKKCVDKINDGYERIKKYGVNDYNSKDLVNNKGIAAFSKLKKNAAFGPTQRMLSLYQSAIDEAKIRVDKIISEIDSKKQDKSSSASNNKSHAEQHSTSDDIKPFNNRSNNDADTIASENNVEQYLDENSNSNEVKNKEINNSTQANLPFSGGDFNPIQIKSQLSPTTTPLLSRPDILGRLEGKLEQNEIFLVRRIFRVLDTYCPDDKSAQTLIKNLEERIIKELCND